MKDQWSPALTIKTALMSLQALMCSPEPDDPQDAEVARMYKTSYPTFAQVSCVSSNNLWIKRIFTYNKERSHIVPSAASDFLI